MTIYVLLGLAVLFLTTGQVLQKLAVDRCGSNLAGRRLFMSLGRRPELWLAIACLGAGMLAWLLVLRSMDVSKAFPFLSVSQVIILLFARFSFHEHLPPRRWLGALLIFAGIGLVAGT
ncbi:MAG: EamA family transporter [Gammaproteobacteria bacterium]